VHVERAENEAKFWLDPLEVALNCGFPEYELAAVFDNVADHREEFLVRWDKHFGNRAWRS
jgi:hypothetical protein